MSTLNVIVRKASSINVTVNKSSGNTVISNLSGGLTGQWLKKNSNTSYDLVWSNIAISDVTSLTSTLSGKLDVTTANTTYTKVASNLSDLQSVSTARTNLGLVAGGSGDIWVEKLGDGMTGNLSFVVARGTIFYAQSGNSGITKNIQLIALDDYSRSWISCKDKNNRQQVAFGWHGINYVNGNLHNAYEIKTSGDPLGLTPDEMFTRFSIGTDVDKANITMNSVNQIIVRKSDASGSSFIFDGDIGNLTLSGSVTATSLTLTTTPLAVTNGGTGSTTKNFVDLTTTQTVAGTKTFSAATTFAVNGQSLFVGDSTNTAVYQTYNGRSYVGYDGSYLNVQGGSGKGVAFATDSATFGSNQRWRIGIDGHFVPVGNNTYNIGSASASPATIYTNNINVADAGIITFLDSTYFLRKSGTQLWLGVGANSQDVKISYGGSTGKLVVDQFGQGTVLSISSSVFTYSNGVNMQFGTTTGTKIGTGSNQKIGFYNATPVVQPTGVAVSAAGIHAALVSLGLITA